MKKFIFTLSVLITLLGCKPAEYLKFDNNPPALQPKVFAANIFLKNNEYVGYCAISPDGSELYYAITNSEWAMSKIIRISSHNLVKKTL